MSAFPRLRHKVSKSLARYPINWAQHFGLSDDDVFVAGYPKSGTTWLRFLIFDLVFGQSGGFDEVNHRIPDVGKHFGCREIPSIGKRLIKTHEPYRSEYCKAIYITRDPRDVVISEYYYQILTNLIAEDYPFDDFVEQFVEGTTNRYGSWSDHVMGWTNVAPRIDSIRISFEEMKADPAQVLRRVATFLSVGCTDARLREVVNGNSVGSMKEKEAAAKSTVFRGTSRSTSFVRQGRAGGWRSVLSDRQQQLIFRSAGPVMRVVGYE